MPVTEITTDIESRTITITAEFAAPVERVWEIYADARQLKEIWGPPDYPAKDVWWELVERYGVTILYTAPTAIRACMKWGVEHPRRHDLSSLRQILSTGSPLVHDLYDWTYANIKRDLLLGSITGGTDMFVTVPLLEWV